jgi:hypothetical protein
MIPRPEFRFQPRSPVPCDICANAILEWSLRTYVSETPVDTVCADCAVSILKAVIANPVALQTIDAQDRNQLGRTMRANVSDDFVKQAVNDSATAKRLLS